MRSDSRTIVVALDKSSAAEALALADTLDPELCRVKVGKELFTSAGPSVVDELHQRGFEVFLDLKFHDIPNTVAGACRAAASLGVWMVNVHACGGERMMAAARDALGAPGDGVPLLIAVTVLTSMDQQELQSVGVQRPVDEQVMTLAQLTHDSGLDGVVCSAREAAQLKRVLPDQLRVTPGIRMADDNADDQQRITTPQQAVADGATHLVIGRSVTSAADPVAQLKRIQASLHA